VVTIIIIFIYQVTEEEYAKLVAKRRKENANFVVGAEENDEYVDMGEEEDWTRENPAYRDDEGDDEDGRNNANASMDAEDEDGGAANGNTKSKKELAKEKKRKQLEKEKLKASKGVGLAGLKMDMKKRKAELEQKEAEAADADALLEDILAGVDQADDDMLGDAGVKPALKKSKKKKAKKAKIAVEEMDAKAKKKAAFAKKKGVAFPDEPPLNDEDDDAVKPMDDHDDDMGAPAAVADDDDDVVVDGTVAPPDVNMDDDNDDKEVEDVDVKKMTTAKQALPTENKGAGAAIAYGDYDSEDDEEDAELALREKLAAEWKPDSGLPVDDFDKTLPFYFLDAQEDIGSPGTVFLFGKVPTRRDPQTNVLDPSLGTVSSCAVVNNMQRCVFVVPRLEFTPQSLDESNELKTLEEKANAKDASKADKVALLKWLQVKTKPVKDELKKIMSERGVDQYTMKPVYRKYCFERNDIPSGGQYVIKLKYSYLNSALPSDIKGETFCGALGTQTNALEHLLVKSKIMGPSWLALHNAEIVPQATLKDKEAMKSWCKLEVNLQNGHKSVRNPTVEAIEALGLGGQQRDPPTVIVAALKLQTVVNHKTNANEICSASVVYLQDVRVDVGTDCRAKVTDMPCEWEKKARHFSLVRKLSGGNWPSGWEQHVANENKTNNVAKRTKSIVLSAQADERGLLSILLARLSQIDADVICGHNVAGFDVDVLLNRLRENKVAHWSRIGRLKRTRFPNLSGGNQGSFGGGASIGALSCMSGRLLADTYLSARDLLKEVSYTLTNLMKTQFDENRAEIPHQDVPLQFNSTQTLWQLTKNSQTDAFYSLWLMLHLQALPLTRQLSNIAGNTWSKTLGHTRAQRVEFLFLHEFHKRKYMVPDRLSAKEKRRVQAAEAKNGNGDKDVDDKKGPQYSGGLVLEPKKGLYDKYVLMLDFNSLYPSIIQEYDICFTTVKRGKDMAGLAPELPPPVLGKPGGENAAVLPQVICKLVQHRRAVKELLKKETNDVIKAQLDIRQLALKLTANSMYGCLGFSASRFYAKPLAELITGQGREILQSTVDLAQNLSYDVIYGDTDSIMINTNKDNLAEVHKVGQEVKREVNKRYKLLEIEMDGCYRSMLLLKKKKYAAVVVEPSMHEGKTIYVERVEKKGLDTVRRDWCKLAKDVGDTCLDEIFKKRAVEDTVEKIHDALREARTKMVNNQVNLESYIVTKQLTKSPRDYPDANSQPHVKVALRRIEQGKQDGVNAGETVPYIICCEVKPEDEKDMTNDAIANGHASSKSGGKGLAERAFHPEELQENPNLRVDLHYYLTQQLHPVISRLCAPIEGTDAARLADCLGLDASKFAARNVGADDDDMNANRYAACSLDDDAMYEKCEPLKLFASDGKTEFTFPGVRDILLGKISCADALKPPSARGVVSATEDKENATTTSVKTPQPKTPGSGTAATTPDAATTQKSKTDASATTTIQPLSAAAFTNQVTLQVRKTIQKYYAQKLRSDDELYPCETRDITLKAVGDVEVGTKPLNTICSGVMKKSFEERELYTQLVHFKRLLSRKDALGRIKDQTIRGTCEKNITKEMRTALDLAKDEVEEVLNLSAYRWVNLSTLFGF
jgi:DNA polymerase alpha subunit A|tara:strand:- start:870 stop:5681 length:4812 start_codon:yes stop_codon:yes gene_type:complete